MAIVDLYPGIRRIALLVAGDNGLINRDHPQEEWLASLDPILGADGVDAADLNTLDQWSASLSDEDAETLAAGEHTDILAIEARCPKPELCGLYSAIFEA